MAETRHPAFGIQGARGARRLEPGSAQPGRADNLNLFIQLAHVLLHMRTIFLPANDDPAIGPQIFFPYFCVLNSLAIQIKQPSMYSLKISSF